MGTTVRAFTSNNNFERQGVKETSTHPIVPQRNRITQNRNLLNIYRPGEFERRSGIDGENKETNMDLTYGRHAEIDLFSLTT